MIKIEKLPKLPEGVGSGRTHQIMSSLMRPFTNGVQIAFVCPNSPDYIFRMLRNIITRTDGTVPWKILPASKTIEHNASRGSIRIIHSASQLQALPRTYQVVTDHGFSHLHEDTQAAFRAAFRRFESVVIYE